MEGKHIIFALIFVGVIATAVTSDLTGKQLSYID